MKKIGTLLIIFLLLTSCTNSYTPNYLSEDIIDDYNSQIQNLEEELSSLENSLEENKMSLEYANIYLNEVRYVTKDMFYHKYDCCDLYKKRCFAISTIETSEFTRCPNCIRIDYTKYYDYPAYYDPSIKDYKVIEKGNHIAYITSSETVDVNSIVFNCYKDNYFHKLNCSMISEPLFQMSIEVAKELKYTECPICMK